MADPELSPPPSRRTNRAVRAQHWRRVASVTGGGVVIALAIGVALVFTNVVNLPGSADAHVTAAHPDPTTTTTPRARATGHHRALTGADPLRLWIAGDSLAGSVGPSLGQMTADTGVVQPQYDSRVSSGLLNTKFFDWPKHVTEQLALLRPEAVVFIVGTNDANVWSPSLAADYRLRTERLMRQLVGPDHREVLWVGAPVAKTKSLETGVLAVDQIQKNVAASIAGVTYFDSHALFDDALGQYQQSFPDELGRRQVMRAGDGVHFSVAGGDYISRALFRILDRHWDLTAQSILNAPKTVRETEGSTLVPGTHRSVGQSTGSGSSSSSGSTSTSTTSTTTFGSGSTSTTTTTTSPPASSTTTSSSTPPST